MAEERESDSVAHTRRRRTKMQMESDRLEQEQASAEKDRNKKQKVRDKKIKEEEAQLLTQQAGLIPEGATRESLLQRIRDMREEVVAQPPAPPPMTDYQKQQLALEQKAGADGVKKAEEEQKRNLEARQKAEAEAKAREGSMTLVHHPNPGQEEQFPAQNATLGKKK